MIAKYFSLNYEAFDYLLITMPYLRQKILFTFDHQKTTDI